MELDAEFIAELRSRIEDAVASNMEETFGHNERTWKESFRPELKHLEKIVSFYDYFATGISVLARPAARGDEQALRMIDIILDNSDYYRTEIYGRNPIPERPEVTWTTPLRRLLYHLAEAYDALGSALTKERKRRFREILEDQVPEALKHVRNFLPGEKNLHLLSVNNHTAIFMQGIYRCGEALGRSDWMQTAMEFAERYVVCGHPDGYWEENANAAREGGPSLVYTPLTAGCLFDMMKDKPEHRERFVKAGDFFRCFLNSERCRIPLADERTNGASSGCSYGLALHSLTPEGRGFLREHLEQLDITRMWPEGMAVIYSELGRMETGDADVPEYKTEGEYRISLPLGIVRKGHWTVGLSALRALNRTLRPESDYALDQQSHIYLYHDMAGVLFSSYKSKADPEYSTFRIGDDAYTLTTGKLELRPGGVHATLYYGSFTGEIDAAVNGKAVRLVLTAATERSVTTTLPVVNRPEIESDCQCEDVVLKGFSPYTSGNKAPDVNAVRFRWKRKLEILVYAPE